LNPLSIICFIVGIGIASISKELNPGYGFVWGYWPALLGLIVASAPWIYFHALDHSEKIKKGIWPSHGKASLIRIVLASVYILPVNAYDFNWTRVIDLYVFAACLFGIVFNFSLNHFRNKHPLYIGIKDGKDSIIDTLFGKLGNAGGLTLFIVEVLGMIVTGYIFTR